MTLESSLPGGFHESAVAAARSAARADRAVAACGVIGPDDDFAAVASPTASALMLSPLRHRSSAHCARPGSRRQSPPTNTVPPPRSPEHRAGLFDHPDLLGEHADLSATVRASGRRDRAGHQGRATRLHLDRPALVAARASSRCPLQRRIARGAEHDLAVFARRPHCPRSPCRDSLPVRRKCRPCPTRRRSCPRLIARFAQRPRCALPDWPSRRFHRLAGGEYHFALRRLDDAAVLDALRRDQHVHVRRRAYGSRRRC